MATDRRPLRVANCSGFYGDRLSAMAEMLRGGDIDVITGDYLAEVTMLVLAKDRLKDPEAGYARTFERQIDPLLEEIAARGVKVVVNAGGLAPATLASRLRSTCATRGVPLRIAHVEGDDLLPRLQELQAAGHGLPHLDTGKPLSSWGHRPLTANAYLGAWGIVDALGADADIVICPRVTDASLALGPAAWWHGWARDDWDALAGAIVAGHIIECGVQATGGNYSGVAEIANPIRPGFPIAEIAADGSSVITKHPGAGGAVTLGTVTAQLLYEIQGVDYLNPDVTVQLDTVQLRELEPDRVLVAGTRGTPPPPTTKVALTALGGFENSMLFVLTGLDVDGKARLLEQGLSASLDAAGVSELRIDRIGGIDERPANQLAASTLLRVSVKGTEKAAGRGFFDASVELALASYPGLFALRGGSRAANAFGVYWPALVHQDVLAQVVVTGNGRRSAVPPPSTTGPAREHRESTSSDRDWGEMEEAPLGWLFDARSGDKGGNANIGVWARDEINYAWLTASLAATQLKELLPEVRDLTVTRHDLPNLRAVNFVIEGLLDGGATETLRLDAQGKALGEYLRAKIVRLPVALIRTNDNQRALPNIRTEA